MSQSRAPAARTSLDAAKLLVTSRALRLRRDHPTGSLATTGRSRAPVPRRPHVVAFCRAGQAMTVATRLPGGLRRAGGWRDTALPCRRGRWRDVLTGAEHRSAAASGGSQATAGSCSPT